MRRIGLLAVVSTLPLLVAQERPWARPIVTSRQLAAFSFAGAATLAETGFRALHAVDLEIVDGRLVATGTGDDPYLVAPALDVSGDLRVAVTGDFAIAGALGCYWSTAAAPGMAEARSVHARAPNGHGTVELRLGPVERLTALRFDPGGGVGRVAIESIRVLDDVAASSFVDGVAMDGSDRLRLSIAADGGDRRSITVPARFVDGFAQVGIDLPAEIRAARQGVHLHDAAALRAAAPDRDGLVVAVHPGLSAAVVYRDRRALAVLHPLAMRRGVAIPLRPIPLGDGVQRFAGSGVRVTLGSRDDELVQIAIDAQEPVEGPVVRTLAPHLRAVLPGLEFLGHGEPSSSAADIETEARFRFAPDPLAVTWPAAAVETADATIAVTWEDPAQQVVFAAPDVYDGLSGARVALRGTRVRATLDVGARDLDDAVLRAVQRIGLPAAVDDGREHDAWQSLCREALEGPLRSDAGFGHCVEPNWPRQPYVDHCSAWWRLTGALPAAVAGGSVALVPGGAHLHDDAAWFVAGQAGAWAAQVGQRAAVLRDSQRADGTWEYRGPYRRGHFEDTSSGLCGERAELLLWHARVSGDAASLAAGLRALAASERFATPRGAQTWELSLHTPDILAAAHQVSARVLAFELTGDPRHLAAARVWAVRGLPFIYLRDDAPAMPFATIAVFGATNWRAPLWIGLPVQWCGLVHADALARLAAHDDALDWRAIAAGIQAAARRMQAGDGPFRGCLPDSFDLRAGRGNGPWINPCAMLALDARLRGEPWELAVCTLGDGRRATSAWPLREVDGALRADAGRDAVQVVVDGHEVVTVPGRR